MADLNSIYNRLNQGSQFTPLSVETFGDWSMEAGDIIIAQKNGVNYQTPIMQSMTKWNGASMITVESVGKQKRDAINVQSKRRYSGGGGGGYYNEKKMFTRIEQTDEHILLEAEARISETAGLRGSIQIEHDRIGLVVEGTGDNARIKPASIVASINNGESNIKISADHVDIDGILTVDRLKNKIADINALTVKALTAQSITVQYASTFNGPLIANGGVYGPGVNCFNVYDIEISGNTMTIYYIDKSPQTFSKATSLSGEWSGNVQAGKSYKVTASPQGNVLWSPQLDGMYTSGGKTWASDNKSFTQKIRVYDAQGTDLLEEEMSFDTTPSWNAGANSVTTIRPTNFGVFATRGSSTFCGNLNGATAGKYICFKVGSTTYSILLT